MYRMQKAMRIRYLILMIILTVSLISLRISINNYNYIKSYEGYFTSKASVNEIYVNK